MLTGRWQNDSGEQRFEAYSMQVLSEQADDYAAHVRQGMSDPTLPPNTQDTVLAAALGNPSQVGSWSPVYDLGVYALHATLRPDGKVLFWYQTNVTNAADPLYNTVLWDPVTNSKTSASNASLNSRQAWCAAHTQLGDGTMFAATGLVAYPDASAFAFNHTSNSWTRLANLNFGRYSPTTTFMGDGRVVVAGGDYITPNTTTAPNPYQLRSFRSVNFPSRSMAVTSGLGTLSTVSSSSSLTVRNSATFWVRPGLADAACVSFESKTNAGQFLRHASFRLRLSANDGSTLFKQDVTFCPRASFAGSGISFESYNFPTHYIRHRNFELWIDPYATTTTYKNDASFVSIASWAP